ncbi:hypothetical protein [Streptomyces sp. ST2-7A]|uniref:hypothetical protein n=1 Tax=Streptomyces sp. ST2-7A TaxID=2907214 RepID=UPI001F412C17|nr:hypothetical protein [Streptomyces sp. ST2-7A]MCE7081725.1 hypothetical protein [Streptomyces sp. ST2-7A]
MRPLEGIKGRDNELCGLWVELDGADYIFREASTSPLHRDHIVLHEISHMLLGHNVTGGTGGRGPGVDLKNLFTTIDPRIVRTVLGRANFSNAREREAELLATCIAKMADLRPVSGTRAPELDRLDAALRGESDR